AQLFQHALIGMFQSIGPLKAENAEQIERIVAVPGIDYESVLVNFLSEALYLSDMHNEAYYDAHVHEVDAQHVRATIYGTRVRGFEVVELKAVTYHDLHIKEINNGWQVDIVFDI